MFVGSMMIDFVDDFAERTSARKLSTKSFGHLQILTPPPHLYLKDSNKISCRSVGLCISKVGRTTDLHFYPWKKRCLFIVRVFITYSFDLIYHIFLCN